MKRTSLKYLTWFDLAVALFNLVAFIITGAWLGLIWFIILSIMSASLFYGTYYQEYLTKKNKKKAEEIKYISKTFYDNLDEFKNYDNKISNPNEKTRRI